jgi:leader peptidase (prepilin peptidase)/N-methyltransferase
MQIPFGPFLSAGALLYVFFGETVIDWYFFWAVS